MSSQQIKRQLRHRLRSRLRNLSPEKQAAASARICAILNQALAEKFPTGAAILFFAPRPGFPEPDIWPVFQVCGKNYQCAFPKITDRENQTMRAFVVTSSHELQIATAHFALLEPVTEEQLPPEKIDLVVLPALGIDQKGNRLGYGQGFYDRFLKQVRTDCQKWAVVFSKQRVEKIPEEAHDVSANAVIDETGFSSFSS